MNAEIITCGTELLLGHIVNTNTPYIAKALSNIGIDIYNHVIVGDNKDRLSTAINEALSRADLVIITGGLGPTVDDITTGTIASVIKQDLVFEKAILKNIKDHFKKCAHKLPKGAIKQALIPRGAKWILNKVGTAPGLILKYEDRHLIALPGPPRELQPMVNNYLISYLKKTFRTKNCIIKSKSLKISGIPEVLVNEKVKDLLELSGPVTLGIYTYVGEVLLRITAKAENAKGADKLIKKYEGVIRKKLDDHIYGSDGDTLQGLVGEALLKYKKTLAVAESCTGGLISNLITDVPGSSKYFISGLVAYDNKVKTLNLNIKDSILKKDGAVSKNVAKLMADGIRTSANTDIGIGVTGIAGPGGETKKKPIGLVYVALSTKKNAIVKEFKFLGSREEIKLQAAQQTLNLLRQNIKK